MRWQFHKLTSGAAVYAVTGGYFPTCMAMIGSIIPDLLELGVVRHRTITHWPPPWIVLTLVSYGAFRHSLNVWTYLFSFICFGALLHLGEDYLSVSGIPFRSPHCARRGAGLYACSQNAFTIVAETEEAIKAWLSNHYGKKLNPAAEKIPFVLLDRPLHPEEYPRFVANLFRVIHENAEANRIVQEYLCYGISSRMKILLGFPGRNGFAFAGLVLPPYDHSVLQQRSPRTPMEKLGVGFRNGKMRSDVLLQRYCSVPLKGAMVQRCDPPWVHGRGHNPDTGTLMQKTVVMVGTGSLGSGVVELLAKMGVGKVILVDPENLHPENASRHSLGVSPVPVAKVVEMAKSLRHGFPHLEFVPHVMGWNRLYDRTPQVFMSADLIISSVGSWTAEGPLNVIAKGTPGFPPILFGWLEEHASAGHAVAIFGGRGCLHCMMNHRGQAKTPVTRWPEEGTLLPIPMCGGMFQPYGAVELSHVQALIADLTADILLGRVSSAVHRAWIGQQKLLAFGGGQWNRDWTDLHGHPGDGGRMMEVPFRHYAACPVCKELR